MKKPNIKKLKYPLWFNIVFYVLTVLTPVIALLIQGFRSPSKIFRITFGVLAIALVLWLFAKRFILKHYEEKLIAKQTALEHDYEIEVGDSTKIKWLWFSNELWLTFFNIVTVMLIGGLISVLAVGIQNAVIAVKAITMLIAILYVVAYIIKVVLILSLRGKDEDTSEKEENKDSEVNENEEQKQ